MITHQDIKEEFYQNGLNIQEWATFRKNLHQRNEVDLEKYCKLSPLQNLVAQQLKLCNREVMPDIDFDDLWLSVGCCLWSAKLCLPNTISPEVATCTQYRTLQT